MFFLLSLLNAFFPVWLRFGICGDLTCVTMGNLPFRAFSDDNVFALVLQYVQPLSLVS